MEYDFSDKAKKFLESQAAKRPGRKSGAQTPAKPSERKKGSKKNPKGKAMIESNRQTCYKKREEGPWGAPWGPKSSLSLLYFFMVD